METGPKGIEDQNTLSPLETFLARKNLNWGELSSEMIATAIEADEITSEEGLDIYKEYTAKIEQESTTDHLTGLLNRRGYERRLNSTFENLNFPANKREVAPVAVLLLRIDLNDLRGINKFGHAAGDAALAALAEAIKINTRDNDIAARVGGDEFGVAIVLESTDLEADFTGTIGGIAQRFQENLEQNITPIRITIKGQEILIKVSSTVGYAIADKKTPVSWRKLDEAADLAATQRKEELKQSRKVETSILRQSSGQVGR